MPVYTISRSDRENGFAESFSKFLPQELKISESPLGFPIIIRSKGLQSFLKEEIARLSWDARPQIEVKDPDWFGPIKMAVIMFESQSGITIVIAPPISAS